MTRQETGDGGVLLHRLADAAAAPVRGRREPARVITVAWGERYLGDLLTITIPALLAPGNIPALAEQFECDFVVVTEQQFFDRILSDPAIAKLLRSCNLRLMPVDDLLSPWYGVSLTYALLRGFANLGERMIDTHLFFLNADFVVADGSYRRLGQVIARGERLAVSPSYCMVLEETVGLLRSRLDAISGALSITARELARIILDHRHNSIRAKTVNQQLFWIGRHDQFYWHVDDNTLLGRQLPIALVYMRPERAITKMQTFWDYGAISEFCPTTRPFVLGDSDDFLMAELRTAGTFNERLRLGWPTIRDIAADLASFSTKDQRDLGRHTLKLHAHDLPAATDDACRKLADFVDRVYERLPPPLSHLDHPLWAAALPGFESMQGARLQNPQPSPGSQAREAAAKGQLAGTAQARSRAGRLSMLYRALLGGIPHTTAWHPYHAPIRNVCAAIAAACAQRAVLVIGSEGVVGPLLLSDIRLPKVAVTPQMVAKELWPRSSHSGFDLCFCYLSFDELGIFGTILEKIRPLMSEGGRVVVFHMNAEGRRLADSAPHFVKNLFPAIGSSRIAFTGSAASSWALRLFDRVADSYHHTRGTGLLLLALRLASCMALARCATWLERRRNLRVPPRHCTSMTIELTLH